MGNSAHANLAPAAAALLAAGAAAAIIPNSFYAPFLVGAAAAAAAGIAALVANKPLHQSILTISRALLDEPPADLDPLQHPKPVRPLIAAITDSRENLAQQASRAASRARELEVARRVSEADLRLNLAVLDALRDAVIVTDQFDELTSANHAACQLLNLDPDSTHKPIDELPIDEQVRDLIREIRQSNSLADRRTSELSLPDPRAPKDDAAPPPHRVFEILLAPLPDADRSEPSGVVTIFRDITAERETSQMKTDFVSQVSHELRTPLSSINAYVEMLLDGEARDDESRREFYTIIKNEADRLSRLIDNMLNISRIEAGIVQIERSEVDFAKIVRDAIEIMQPQAKLKNISLISKPGPLIYTAQADRDMIHQVVLNLISNAVKYTPEGGRVTVAVENDDATRSVLVSVSDTGLGIPPDVLPKLFQKFYRIDNYKRVAKGTGLGLALVKHIVETVHHGQVGVASTVGLGSKFWFTVPYEPSIRKAA
ncbi:MAG: sensor histidine kinase [Phycisphaerales bacterium]